MGDFQGTDEAPKGAAQRTTEVYSPAIKEDWAELTVELFFCGAQGTSLGQN